VREIPDEDSVRHVGLDAEATAILNEIYNGGEVDTARMKPQNLLLNLPLARRA